jgi:hypothetical protein
MAVRLGPYEGLHGQAEADLTNGCMKLGIAGAIMFHIL